MPGEMAVVARKWSTWNKKLSGRRRKRGRGRVWSTWKKGWRREEGKRRGYRFSEC